MAKANSILLLALAAMVVLSACAKKEHRMMNLRASGRGPDEFAILPTKPLVLPKSYSELPAPSLGGTNLTDPTPRQDAVAALGGNPKRLLASGIPAGDSGIVSMASRYGSSANIRAVLVEEDKKFRSRNRGKILERLFGVTVYFGAYEKQALDRYAELERMRKSGIRTPAAPPESTE